MKSPGIGALSLATLLFAILIGCNAPARPPLNETVAAPTVLPLLSSATATPTATPPPPQPTEASREEAVPSPTPVAGRVPDLLVRVDVDRGLHPISPLIYGLSTVSDEHVTQLRTTLASWGGNPSTRYNWQLGNAWNSGSDWFYRNGNYGFAGESASDDFVARALDAGLEVRLALPTLGWVAKDNDNDTCSFPLPGGGCGDAGGANCANPGPIADPTLANVPSDADSVKAWLEHLIEKMEFDIRFLAMDNEPELWGYTHYDVHPTCTNYEEILEKFLTYAEVARSVVPEVEITGPVTCCWYFYWNSAAGLDDMQKHGHQEFLPWFLDQVREHDQANGRRTLDVLDIHYYPEGVYNNNIDESTAGHRLRSTRSLWDKTYVDESWINQPVNLIPTMKAMIEEHYPGTKLGISEWNWGADETMNGALAIADVLGVFGREDIYLAAYWREPPLDSPGFYAFKIFTNYDDQGSRFGDTATWTETGDWDTVSAYAALSNATGNLHLMLVHKQSQDELEVQLDLDGFNTAPMVQQYRYSAANPAGIVSSEITVDAQPFNLSLPPESITLLVMPPAE